MNLLLFLSPDQLAYFLSHDYLSYINSLVFLFIFCVNNNNIFIEESMYLAYTD